jgi:quercetin dioxygenase-like cupin family protein
LKRMWIGMGAVAAAGIAIGFGLGSALGQAPAIAPGVDAQMIAMVDAGAEYPGMILRMRKVTFAPGASIPMHTHAERPEVTYVLSGTLTDTRKGAAPVQKKAGDTVTNGREVEHMPENKSGKPVVLIAVEFIKK